MRVIISNGNLLWTRTKITCRDNE